jgi:transcription elongation GreA/GreB family factor
MINEYVQMLSQANALRATLEEKLANARESVRKKDERIAELEKELSALRCVAQSSRPGQGFFTIDQVESLKEGV